MKKSDRAAFARPATRWIRGRRPRQVLNEQEIRRLIGLIRDLFAHQKGMRASHQLADLIQFPKVPPLLSESLAVHLINSGVLRGQLGQGGRADLSVSGGDLVLTRSDGRFKQIEVKGTAESAFQHFSSKDVKADIILWVQYGSCFRDGGTCAEIHVLLEPRRFVQEPGRITLRRLTELARGEIIAKRIDLRTLAPMEEDIASEA